MLGEFGSERRITGLKRMQLLKFGLDFDDFGTALFEPVIQTVVAIPKDLIARLKLARFDGGRRFKQGNLEARQYLRVCGDCAHPPRQDATQQQEDGEY